MSTKEYYEQKVAAYAMSGSRKRHILELIKGSSGTVLDIGCGSGELGEALQKRGFIVDGADISEDALAHAGSNIRNRYCFNFEQTWPEDIQHHSYDYAVASEVIEHIFDPKPFLRALHKAVKPDGLVILTTPNVVFWKNRLRILLGKFRYTDKNLMDFGHIRFFTVATMREVAEKNGFTIVQEHHIFPNLEKRKLTFLGKLFPGLFAYQICVMLKPKHE